MTQQLRRRIRVRLAETGLSLVDVARAAEMDYGRLQRVLGGYAKTRPGEIDDILAAIEALACCGHGPAGCHEAQGSLGGWRSRREHE